MAYRLANYRSLSVGDVLEIDGEHLAVASMGFVSVDVPAREYLKRLERALTKERTFA